MFAPHTSEDATDVVDVIADREVTILAGHPISDNSLLPRVERVERLDCRDEPFTSIRDALNRGEVRLRGFRIPMKADEQWPWRPNARYVDENATVRARFDVENRVGIVAHSMYGLCRWTGLLFARTRRLIISTNTEKPIAK